LTYKELLKTGSSRLAAAGVEDHDACARLMLLESAGFSLAELILHENEEADEGAKEKFLGILKRREKREPLEYILGYTEFMGHRIACNKDCLIPSQDTEALVIKAAECAGRFAKEKKMPVGELQILDICTGTGCVGISLGLELGAENVTLSDISGAAVQTAICNAKECAISARVIESDLFKNITGRYDIITANPPYIRTGGIDTLMPEVSVFEPRLALDGGEDGVGFYKRIIADAANYLNKGGWLVFEIGDEESAFVAQQMRAHGYEDVEVLRDLAGYDRVVSGRLAVSDPSEDGK